MKDKIYKKGNKVWIRVLDDDKPLMKWVEDPRCPLSERQLRRRCEAILSGAMHMSVHDAVTKPCKPRDVPAKVKKRERREDKKQPFGFSDPIMAQAVCGRWR